MKKKLLSFAGCLAVIAMAAANFYFVQADESDREVDLLLCQIEAQAAFFDVDRLPIIDSFLEPVEFFCHGNLYGRRCISVEDQSSYCNLNWQRECE